MTPENVKAALMLLFAGIETEYPGQDGVTPSLSEMYAAYTVASNYIDRMASSTPAERIIPVTAVLPESVYQILIDLAKKRGVSANIVLQQAIQTEKYLTDKEAEGSDIFVQGADKQLKRMIRYWE